MYYRYSIRYLPFTTPPSIASKNLCQIYFRCSQILTRWRTASAPVWKKEWILVWVTSYYSRRTVWTVSRDTVPPPPPRVQIRITSIERDLSRNSVFRRAGAPASRSLWHFLGSVSLGLHRAHHPEARPSATHTHQP